MLLYDNDNDDYDDHGFDDDNGNECDDDNDDDNNNEGICGENIYCLRPCYLLMGIIDHVWGMR